MTEDWAALAGRLTDSLQLATPAVAISFVDHVPATLPRFEGPMSEPTADGRRGRVAAGCVFWARGAERGFATTAEDHGNCSVGSVTHGMLEPADAAGREDVATLVGAGWAGPGVLDELPRVAPRPAAVTYAPLAEATLDPDVVLLRVNARQLMVLSDALPGLSIGGKPQCHIVAMAKQHGLAAASVGCALSRQRTGMRSDEMTCALPAANLEAVVDAVETTAATDSVVARYAAGDARRFQV
ncbi:MAG: DUF169 domain-containing protein [Acidimicrobiales bacterium]